MPLFSSSTSMARLPRLIVDGLPHLVSQRVQHGQTLAVDALDRQALHERLRLAAQEHRIAVHAYILLDDRFDVLATPGQSQSLSRFMQAIARRHSADFNRRHTRTGGLWTGRFRVAVVDPEAWMLMAMAFVEQQLHRHPSADSHAQHAGHAGHMSSEAHHTGAAVEPWLTDPSAYWALGNTPFERQQRYRAIVQAPMSAGQIEKIEAALRGGWALGDERFVAELAAHSERPSAPRRPGRPRRASPLGQ